MALRWRVRQWGKRVLAKNMSLWFIIPRFVIGPPVGGLLYGRLGYRAPFVFSEICAILDLVGRLLIIERKNALEWGVDPAGVSTGIQAEAQHVSNDVEIIDGHKDQSMSPHLPASNASPEKPREGDALPDAEPREATIVVPDKHLSLHVVVIRLIKSSRALVALSLSLVWGCYDFFFSIRSPFTHG